MGAPLRSSSMNSERSVFSVVVSCSRERSLCRQLCPRVRCALKIS
jgi:hypothetical protein